MQTLLTRPNPAIEAALPGTYWVFTTRGAITLGKTPGAVICDNPYIAPTSWVREGYVTPEELE